MSDNETILPEPKFFVRDNIVWLLGIVPLLMAAFQILKVSYGDPTVTAYLINNLDILKFGLTLLLPCLPVAGFWCCVAWLQLRSRLPQPQKSELEWTVLLTYLVIAGLMLAMTVLAFVANVVLIAGIFLVRRWFHDRKLKKAGTYEADNRLQLRPALLAVLLALTSVLVSSTIMWIPPEIVSVEKKADVTARVLAADGDWTTYIDTNRTIHIVETRLIQRRTPCTTSTSLSSKPLVFAISAVFGRDETPNPLCPAEDPPPS